MPAVKVLVSYEDRDDRWDEFLASTPEGQFQQTSAWARVKAVTGWGVCRVLFEQDGRVVGGFQMLTRRLKGLFPIGYVSKGPVLTDPALGEFALRTLRETLKSEGVWAVIVQAPDRTSLSDATFRQAGLKPSRLIGVIETTMLVDLSNSFEQLRSQLSRSTRYKLNRAAREGIQVRQGARTDLPDFFELMKQTCRRQFVAPNPASIEEFYAMWDGFAPRGQLELTFAEWAGKRLAGQLTFRFGKTATIWKVGWSEEESSRCPNYALRWDSIIRAAQAGYEWADFAAVSEHIVSDLLAGKLTLAVEKSRDFINIGFGGKPFALPKAYLLAPSLPVRFLLGAVEWVRGRN